VRIIGVLILSEREPAGQQCNRGRADGRSPPAASQNAVQHDASIGLNAIQQ